jgi:hypothetical protein
VIDPFGPLILTALSQIADGTLGEAGSRLWDSLCGLLHRSRDDGGGEAIEAPTELTTGDVAPLAERLERRATADPGFRAALEGWLEEAEAVRIEGNVSNSVSGSANKVVQARDIGSLRIE